jgi:hypothetical protein
MKNEKKIKNTFFCLDVTLYLEKIYDSREVTIHTPVENAMRISLFARQIDFNLLFSRCEE